MFRIALFYFLIYGVIGQSLYDCESEGCDLDPKVNGNQVCGKDGITYLNECLAYCQNVDVVKKGKCPGQKDKDDDEEAVKIKGKIDSKKMKRFEAEGFKFVRSLDPKKLKGKPVPPDNIDNNTGGNTTLTHTTYTVQGLRLTAEGEEYRTIPQTFEIDPSLPSSSADPVSIPSLRRHRDLAILGADNRYRITNTRAFPYSTIYYSNVGCTGTVIYKNAGLTAAHCVYQIGVGWTSHTYIVPGKDGSYEPFGRWSVDYSTTYVEWTQNLGYKYDMAVTKFRLNTSGQSVGDVVGYVGFAEIADYSDSNLQASSVTGYSGDKNGQMWGAQPTAPFADSSDWYLKHYCDTTPGASGSAILGPDSRARGVHGTGTASNNGGVVMKVGNPHYNNAYVWSGRP